MKVLAVLAAALWWIFIMSGCQTGSADELILGEWEIDSTYTFYNGFDFVQTESDGWAIYSFDRDGIMKEVQPEGYMSYLYALSHRDTLLLQPTRGGELSRFFILHLDRKRLVLRKTKDPIFSGGSQQRYEIRYFSRKHDQSSEEPTPFDDPRYKGDQ